MLMRMRTTWLAGLVFVVLAAAVLSACSGGGFTVTDKFAWRMEGGALSGYGGTDGGAASARNTARLLLTGRQFDFTPQRSNIIEPGTAQTWRAGGSQEFGDAEGTQNQIGDLITCQFTVPSFDPQITDVQLVGEFNKPAAESTLSDPASSFMVDWTISFNEAGTEYTLTASQLVTGVNYILD